MPKVFWICPLIQHGPEGAWMPAVVRVLNGVKSHATKWSTTDGGRAAPFAVGASMVDDEQLAALEADNTIHLFQADLRGTRFEQLPAGVRTRIDQFFNNIGAARPALNETLRDFAQRLVQMIDGKNIETHLNGV